MDIPDEPLLGDAGADRNASDLLAIAEELRAGGNLHLAATALDRAFALEPEDLRVRDLRQALLDQLSLTEHGIRFRYIPAGTFLMGSDSGDADESPVHKVRLSYFWIAETPVSWFDYCRLMDWEPPPAGMPRPQTTHEPKEKLWRLSGANRIRLQYCEDETERARDWHAHAPGQVWGKPGKMVTAQQLFGDPQRADPSKPWTYQTKPMICVTWEQAHALCSGLSANLHASMRYVLPTEAQWEKAARGGRIGARYPWGDDPPTHDRCDFARFHEFSILPMKRFAPNDYGLYAMSGCVWEWTADWYDAEFYAQGPVLNPRGPAEGHQKVVRGGSWADCAQALTVSFRMSMSDKHPPPAVNPNIGFRMCRVEAAPRY